MSSAVLLDEHRSDGLRALALRRLRWTWFPLAVFLVHRAALMTISSFGLRIVPALFNGYASETQYSPALRGLCRWDCGMYTNIATRGYFNVGESPVFPFYPLLTRGLSALTGLSIFHSLLVVANLAGLGALIVIYRIFWRLSGMQAARYAIVLLAAFPFAYFHAAGYAESLGMFLIASAILLAMQRRHVASGIMLALGCATRHIGILAGVSLLAIAIDQRGWRPRSLLWHRGVLGLILPFAGLAAYALYCYHRFHHPLAFALSRSGSEYGANSFWHMRAWWGVREAFRSGRLESEPVLATYVFWSLIPGIGAIGLLFRRPWRSLAPYALVLMTLFWSTSLMGLGRFSASCWPAFLPLGAWLSRRPTVATLVVLPLAMAQGFYFFLWSHWFGIW